MTVPTRLLDKQAQDFANKVGEIFASLPHLPKKWVEVLVKIASPLALLGAVLFALGILNAFRIMSPIGLLVAIISAISAVLLYMAYKPLDNREYTGWMLLFWVNITGAAQTILNILVYPNSFFNLIGVAIGFYILYEMRSSYGMKGKVEALKTDVKKLTE